MPLNAPSSLLARHHLNQATHLHMMLPSGSPSPRVRHHHDRTTHPYPSVTDKATDRPSLRKKPTRMVSLLLLAT